MSHFGDFFFRPDFHEWLNSGKMNQVSPVPTRSDLLHGNKFSENAPKTEISEIMSNEIMNPLIMNRIL